MIKREPIILITGASGFVGAHLMQSRFPAQIFGTFHNNPPQEHPDRYFQLDIADDEACRAVVSVVKPDFLIHCAARSNLDWCEKNKAASWRINAEAPARLAAICAEKNIRYLFVSSDMVFDGKHGNYNEADACNPLSNYGRAKRHAEKAVLALNPAALVARIALVYGLPVLQCGSSFLQWILHKIEHRQAVPLFVDQFRTPISVQELTQILLELVVSEARGIVHVAGPERLNRYQFGIFVCKAFATDQTLLRSTRLAQISQTPPRPRDLSLNIARLKSIVPTMPRDCRTNLQYWAARRKNAPA